MSRVAKRSTAFFSAILALFAVFFALRYAPAISASRAPAASGSLAVALMRAGLGADALAAAGVGANSVGGLAQSAQTALANVSLAQLDAAYGTAKVAFDARARRVSAGLASPEEITELATLTSALEAAESARTAGIDALFAAVTASLTNTQRARLATIRANKAWKLPIELLTVERTEAEWIELRDALSNERITAKHGEATNQACQSLLAAARADATVAAAKVAHDSNLAPVTAAWESATGS